MTGARKTIWINAGGVALATFLLSVTANASEGGGWGRVGFHAVNLAILLGLIVKFSRKPLQSFLNNRARRVTEAIEEAARLQAEARARLDEYEARLGELQTASDAVLAEFREAGEAEKARLITEARAEAGRVRAESERQARNEIARARARLEGELVDRVIEAAARVIEEKMTPADQRNLAAEYLKQLEQTSRS